MTTSFVYDAIRTPRGKGKADGSLAEVAPHVMVSQLIDALRERNGPEALGSVSRLTLGCVGQVNAQGGNVALVSRLDSSLSDSVIASTVNNYCVSGLSAIGSAAALVGEDGLALAGGVESMSAVPFMADKAAYYSDPALAAKLRYVPVALAADRLATAEGISKSELDSVVLQSHHRAAAAWSEGRFAEAVVPVLDADGRLALASDELIRPSLTAERLAALPAAFAKLGAAGYDQLMLAASENLEAIAHSHSIAHCPGMSDGAALALIGVDKSGALKPRASIRAFVEASGDPIVQLGAGFVAMKQALATAKLALADIDVIEFMEAFAAVPALFLRDYDVDPERVNVDGGHLAMGHPMGASGAILVSQLVDVMRRRDASIGMAVAHGGSGVGAAIILERTAAD